MPIKVLIADDSATDRLIISDMLKEYSIFTASNGEEALRVLEEQKGINLLILDLNMPILNGFQVLERIRKDERYQMLRTIILTNYDELDNEIKGLKLGAIDYIRKPIHMSSLKARIEVHLALLRTQKALEQQLDEQKLTFEMIFDQAPIGIAIAKCNDPANPGEYYVRVNSVYEKITGRSRDELNRLGWTKITHPDDVEEDLRYFKLLQEGEINSYTMDKRYIRPDGTIVWVHMVVAPLNFSDGKSYDHICLVQDITESKTIEKALKESERSKSVLISHLPGLAYRCRYDREWTMQYVSEGCYSLTGYAPESLLYNRDLSYNDIISPEYREILWKKWGEILSNRQPFKFEYEIITASGEKKWVLEMGQGIYNDDGNIEALEGIVLDISDKKAIENTLKYNFEHDRWTGLCNRDYLDSLFNDKQWRSKNKKEAFVGINLNAIQLLTAKYGFQYTQCLIIKAAEALEQQSTENCLLFHTYENRFVFYFTDYKDKDELIDFGNTIAETLEALFETDRIGGGIGILELDENQRNDDIDSLLRKLLIASERSVSLFGKDFDICFYDKDLEALVNRERAIEEALNVIAESDETNNDLFLVFQPIVDSKTGSVWGFEALARLKTEKLGFVSPLEFIPITEKTKLILPIGEKVIAKAFCFINKLKERGYDDICVTINISAIQLLKPEFTSRLFEYIHKMQIDPRNVGLEITESVFTSDYKNINRIIERLKNAGIYIAIDDFGTGYSSLAREYELNVHCLKIDKYFIDRLIDTDINRTITGDIITMAHRLGHSTVAEGVEHECQLEYLRQFGCDKIQGYLFSKPLDEENAIKFLQERDKARDEKIFVYQ